MNITGNKLIDDEMEAALESGDIDRIETAFNAMEREGKRQGLVELSKLYREAKEHDGLHTALAMWFERPEAQHAPPANAREAADPVRQAKGDLIRWTERSGVRLPTIRADAVTPAVNGMIEVQGKELLCHLTDRLDPDARAYLLAVFKTVEKTVKDKCGAVERAKEAAFGMKPSETPARAQAFVDPMAGRDDSGPTT